MRAAVSSLAAAVLLLAACPGGTVSSVTPTLPGDGTDHVAKPTDPIKKGDDPWAGRNDLITAPAPVPPAKLELPKVERFSLPNGLAVMVIPDQHLPLVSMQLAIRAGRGDEPKARLGVAEFTANMLVKGTKKNDAAQLAKKVDFVGGTLGADASFEATLLTCNVMVKDISTCLTLLPELVTQPAFAKNEIEEMRQMLLQGVAGRAEDPTQLASAHLQNLLWGDEHVRGWVPDIAAIQAIQRADLVAWHKQWFSPSNAFIVVAGAVDPAKLKTDLTKAFAGWKKTAVPPHPTYKMPSLSGTKIRLVDKPGLTQSQIRIGQFGIRHDDPRFFDTLVWNFALGGNDLDSRLMRAARAVNSRTAATSSFDRNLDRGSFVAATFAKNADTVAMIKLLQAEIAKMAKEGPSDTEVADAVSNLAGSYALKFQSAADVASALLAAELHGFGDEYLANYALAVGQVDQRSAKDAAAELLDPTNYVIVVVGDAREVEPQMKKAGWRYTKVTSNDPIGGVAEPVGSTDAAAIAAATKLLDEALATKGGKKKLEAIKTMVLSVKGETSMQGQTVPIEMTRTLVMPDKTRVDISIAGGQAVFQVGIDGKVGWQKGPDQDGNVQTVDIPESELGSVEADRWRDPELILLRHLEKGATVAPLPDVDIDKRTHAVIRLTNAAGTLAVDLYIDKETKLLGRMSYKDQGVVLTDDFGDYKEIKGIKVAHQRASRGGSRSSVYEITSVEFDGKVDSAVFKKPAEGSK
jgi:zinc protease